MAWTSIVEAGSVVNTPFGVGTVRRVSESGTAQVDVDGQLYDVPVAQMVPEGVIPPKEEKKGLKPWNAKKGKRVEEKEGTKHGEITEVTQRTVRVKWDNGSRSTVPKRETEKQLSPEGAQPEQPKHRFKKGDRVLIRKDSQYSGQSDAVGTVKGMNEGIVLGGLIYNVEFDDGYSNQYGNEDLEKAQPEAKPEPEVAPEDKKVAETGDGIAEIFKLKEYLEKKVDEGVEGELKEIRELAKKNQSLEVKVGDKTSIVKGLKHKQLEQLINYCALRLSPLMVGMAGTGKTHAGEQVAVALGLPFYSMSVGAQTSKSDIIGYMDAAGRYVTTHFRTAYQQGGVFLMDEIDAGNANVLIQINAALSNGLCAFPDMMVERHEDFVFIASANTFGNGANRQYVGRNQLDAATLDRFAVIEWLIDDELEGSLTTGLNGKAWYMAVRATRDYVTEKNIRALVSPRATQKGSKLLDVGQPLDEVIGATLLASVPEDKKADVKEVAVKIFEKFASEVPGQLPKTVNPEATQVTDLIR